MDNDQIVSRMNTYLHTSANVLAEWLGKLLPRTSEDWWEDCVIAKLSYNQAEMARERGFTELGQFDLAALLRIADKSWYEMRNVAFLPTRERECIRDMMRVRNNWAHVGAMLPGKDAILADLDTLHQFFEQRECDDSLVNEVDRMIEEVKSPSTVDFESFSQESQPEAAETVVSDASNEDEIREKSLVYLVGSPDVRGIVMSITDLGDTKKYDVFVDGNFKTFYSGQIALYVETASYNWVDINTFRSYLTAYQINNPSGNDLYSLNSARIDFVPYQFRPALKLIHADEPRILIADSVGVGKTIEAGLIIKELQARNELENVLIICPKPLVTERKWEMEMKRFDEEFVPVDGPMLRQIISDTDRDGEWPIRFSKTIVPYSILDSRAYEGETTRKKHTFGLRDLDPAPHFDLVIIDEAHHIRNGSMEKEKAFEYKCVKYFCDNADAVVMLTATPLQTSDDDLFTLLNVLRPDVVIDKQTFNMMSRPNVHISEAAKAIRRADQDWQAQATEALKGVLGTQWGENVIAANPTWLNKNFTLKRKGGSKGQDVNTIIIDECSMIDLNLFATLIRSINWNSVQRLILVGDPNQLPPIGRGKVFSDTIEWLNQEYPENVGVLCENIRQLVNRVEGNGCGILDLAELFIQEKQSDMEDTGAADTLKQKKEELFTKIMENGNGDIDKDLAVYFWKEQADLETLLRDVLTQDMEAMTGMAEYSGLDKLWQQAIRKADGTSNPDAIQIISPYRGEFYGTGALNVLMQNDFNPYWSHRYNLDGISYFDKVIQFRNRPKSDMAYAYNQETRAVEQHEVYNGEIGLVLMHPFDQKNKRYNYISTIERFQVAFSNKNRQRLRYNYGREYGRNDKGWNLPEQKVQENLELAYAISVHKSQGSEFDYVYIVIPKRDSHLLG